MVWRLGLCFPERSHSVPDSLADKVDCVLAILTKVESRRAVFDLWVRFTLGVRIMRDDTADDQGQRSPVKINSTSRDLF